MKQNKFYYFALTCFFLILFLPLLNLPPWFSPPAWGKTIVFRCSLGLLLLVFLIKYKFNLKEIKEALKPKTETFLPFSALLAFFSVTLLSTLFSLDISQSFWGDPNRAGGFLNFFFYFVFCLLSFLLIKRQDWGKLLNFSLVIGFLAALIGVFQKFGILIFISGAGRPSSLMGNPIIFSLYLLPLVFLSLSFFSIQKNIIKKSLYLLNSLFLIYTIIFITQTRAAFLGLAIGFFWFLIAYPGKRKLFRFTAVVFLIAIAGSLFVLQGNPQIYEDWRPAISRPVARIATLAKGLEAETSRPYVWRTSLTALQDRPILGYGPENFSIAFDRYYDADGLNMEKARWFDRAHNSLIDILISSGIFALVFYLIFIGSLLWKLQKIKKEEPVSHGLQAGFLAYLTAAFFSIEGFSNFLIFSLFCGFSLHLIFKNKNYLFEKTRGPIFILLSSIIFIWFIVSFNLAPLKTSTNINIAKDMANNKNWQAVAEVMEKEREKENFLSFYTNYSYYQMIAKALGDKTEILKKRVSLLEKNTELKPNNAKNWFYLGQVSRELFRETGNIQDLTKAEKAFEETVKLSPNDLTAILNSFLVSKEVANWPAIAEKAEYCLKKYPETKECLWMSGLVKIYQGKIEAGMNIIKEAKEKEGWLINQEEFLIETITALAAEGHYQETVPLHYELIELNPKKTEYKESLALVFQKLGQYQKAKDLALEILKQSPKSKDKVEAFLKTLE